MKKKLLFTAYNLDLGGIEKSLINLLNRLDYSKYDVTLILEKKEGIFLDRLPKEVKVLEYKISTDKNPIVRKIKNRNKLMKWKKKLNNSFDFSCCYATYSIPGSLLALAASKNSNIWAHSDYYVLYNNDEVKMKEFLNNSNILKFKRVIFVSDSNKDNVCSHFEEIKDKSYVCNNYIDGEEVIRLSKEKIDYKRGKETLFVNVGRQREFPKRLSRIIKASKRLKDEGYKFKIVFVGYGDDSKLYEDMIKEYNLTDTIDMVGGKSNPYPYFNMADAVILCSDFEGYPVVFLESMILNKPILSTKVGPWSLYKDKFGLFCDINDEAVYKMMKEYLDNGFKIKDKFDYKEYNNKIDMVIDSIINDTI